MTDLDLLTTTLQKHPSLSLPPDDKAKTYIGKFFARERVGARISAKVDGNHGTYTVSIRAHEGGIEWTCSCYVDKHGCHHCAALALTFLQDPTTFAATETKELDAVRSLPDLDAFLSTHTLEGLLIEMKNKGITQKAFAE